MVVDRTVRRVTDEFAGSVEIDRIWREGFKRSQDLN